MVFSGFFILRYTYQKNESVGDLGMERKYVVLPYYILYYIYIYHLVMINIAMENPL